MEKFSKVLRSQSVPVIDEEILFTMKAYQNSLINTLLYEPPKTKKGLIDNFKTTKIVAEIRRLDKWLKIKFNDWANNNNRKISA